MPVEVKIPQLGESVTEAEIVRWLKDDGASVVVDEPIAEIETDKATAELPAPASGVLQVLVAAGSTVKPGEVVARIAEGGAASVSPRTTTPKTEEAAPAAASPTKAKAAPRKAAVEKPAAPPQVPTATPTVEAEPAETAPAAPGKESILSPAARRLAEENDIEAGRVPGSGRGGRVTKQDVLTLLRAGEGTSADELASADTEAPAPEQARPEAPARLALVRDRVAVPGGPAASARSAEGEERLRMSRLRRSIAQRLVDAQHTAAILTTFNEIDMSRVMELRARFKDTFAKTHGVSLGFMSFFARACVLALKDVREVNARIEGDEIVYASHVHLGIAASTDRGLVVPVVRNADSMSLADLEREIGRLAELARTGKIGLEDLAGGTFTISNGGVFGSLLSTPILNPPQSGILGMHKIEKRPVVVNDQIVIRPMMYVALSYDHRLIDGREAVTFLVRVKERIEDPERLLLEI